jgi:hypothetical protein
MQLKFETSLDGSYYTLSNDNNQYGYTLTKHTPTKTVDAKKPFSTSSLFYATLEQAVEKVLYLQLKGHDVNELLTCYENMVERLTQSFKNELRPQS